MKGALIALVLAVALTIPVAASAQDWVMDWNSTGNTLLQPFTWNITGSSPTALTPIAGGLPPFFTGQSYQLSFTSEGMEYGGKVATGPQFQTDHWSVPAPCTPAFNCRASYSFANGTFNFTDADHFALDVDMGTGHDNAHFVGLGHRASVTASAAEPTVLLLSAAGLVGAAVLRRSRRS
jgi:hypothetical protein